MGNSRSRSNAADASLSHASDSSATAGTARSVRRCTICSGSPSAPIRNVVRRTSCRVSMTSRARATSAADVPSGTDIASDKSSQEGGSVLCWAHHAPCCPHVNGNTSSVFMTPPKVSSGCTLRGEKWRWELLLHCPARGSIQGNVRPRCSCPHAAHRRRCVASRPLPDDPRSASETTRRPVVRSSGVRVRQGMLNVRGPAASTRNPYAPREPAPRAVRAPGVPYAIPQLSGTCSTNCSATWRSRAGARVPHRIRTLSPQRRPGATPWSPSTRGGSPWYSTIWGISCSPPTQAWVWLLTANVSGLGRSPPGR